MGRYLWQFAPSRAQGTLHASQHLLGERACAYHPASIDHWRRDHCPRAGQGGPHGESEGRRFCASESSRHSRRAAEATRLHGHLEGVSERSGASRRVKVGAVDFAHSGDAPPIFAQAAGAPFLYIGHEPAAPNGEAIIVPKDSPIKTVAELKGKKIALNKGSNVHYLLVRALDKVGLKITDVELVYLPPASGRAAFEKGDIDAWVIWEPYRTSAEMSLGARTLTNGTGLVSNYEFFFTTKAFAGAHPQIIDVVLGAARDVYAEAAKDIRGTAKTFSVAAGFPEPVMEVALSTGPSASCPSVARS